MALVFQLLRAVLTGQTDSNFLATILNDLQLLVLFVILLVYHLSTLRRDGDATADALAKKRGDFKVLVLDSGEGFGEAVRTALAKARAGCAGHGFVVSTGRQLQCLGHQRKPGDGCAGLGALIQWDPDHRPGGSARSHLGRRRRPSTSIQQAAQTVRQLAEGQAVLQQKAAVRAGEW